MGNYVGCPPEWLNDKSLLVWQQRCLLHTGIPDSRTENATRDWMAMEEILLSPIPAKCSQSLFTEAGRKYSVGSSFSKKPRFGRPWKVILSNLEMEASVPHTQAEATCVQENWSELEILEKE